MPSDKFVSCMWVKRTLNDFNVFKFFGGWVGAEWCLDYYDRFNLWDWDCYQSVPGKKVLGPCQLAEVILHFSHQNLMTRATSQHMGNTNVARTTQGIQCNWCVSQWMSHGLMTFTFPPLLIWLDLTQNKEFSKLINCCNSTLTNFPGRKIFFLVGVPARPTSHRNTLPCIVIKHLRPLALSYSTLDCSFPYLHRLDCCRL